MSNFSMVPREGFVDWLLLECPLSSSQKTTGKCSLTNVIFWNDSLEFRAHEISKFIVSILPSTYGHAVPRVRCIYGCITIFYFTTETKEILTETTDLIEAIESWSGPSGRSWAKGGMGGFESSEAKLRLVIVIDMVQ